MNSRWSSKKADAVRLRLNGVSLRTIEKSLEIPRSTLSYWFKGLVLPTEYAERLQQNRAHNWANARHQGAQWHRNQKEQRLQNAERQARRVLDDLPTSDAILDLALCLLYMKKGTHNTTTSFASSDPQILKLYLTVLKQNYGVNTASLRCQLRLPSDQDLLKLKIYWSKQLGIPVERFEVIATDRANRRLPSNSYKGECTIFGNQIAIQRKLIYLYNLFCDKVTSA